MASDVRFDKRFFQLSEDQPVRVRPKDEIEIEIRLDGTTHIRAKGSYLRFKTIEKRPYKPHFVAQPSRGLQRVDPRTKGVGSTPAKTHPWRLFRSGPQHVGLPPHVVNAL